MNTRTTAAFLAFAAGALGGASIAFIAIALGSHAGPTAPLVLVAGPVLPFTPKLPGNSFAYATMAACALMYGIYSCAIALSRQRKRAALTVLFCHAAGVVLGILSIRSF